MSDVILDKIFGEFSFLTDVFNSRPKLENFIGSFVGISCSSASTITSFTSLFGNWKNQSSFNRFFTESKWDLELLTEKYQKSLIEKPPDYFIVDDSKNKKTGEMMDKIYKDFDSSKRETVLCHTVVVSLLKTKEICTPFELTLYDKNKKTNFKSKLTITAEQIQKSKAIIDRSTIFLFDSWYCNPEVITAIPKENCWISRLKRNRTLKIGKFWYKPPEIIGLVKSWEYSRVKIKDKYFWACSIRTEVKNLGIATVVIVKPKQYSKYAEFFISNFDLNAEEILNHYSERWAIEVFFRTAKQDLGLDGYQMRSYKANRRYWSLVILSYSILSSLQQLWRKTCKTIGQTIKRLKKYLQNYGSSFSRVIETYVDRKFAKL